MHTLFDQATDFPAQLWLPLAQNRAAIHCPAGFLIYLQDTEATCFYYLKQGEVKSILQSENGDERVLNLYHAGSIFGAASFFDELPRVSSAVALTHCQIVPIDREQVTQEIAKNPALALSMMKYLARTVRILSEQVDQMAFRPAKWRLAQHLLALPRVSGQINCTQDDIAASISVSRVTVNRILNELSRENIIKLQYGALTVLDCAALQALCQEG